MSDDPTELAQRHCVPCEGGVEPLGATDIATLLPRVPGWTLRRGPMGDELTRTVTTPDFVSAVDLVVLRLTPIAESEGHHPDLEVGWGKVTIHLTTHAAEGLTPNDFILAARFDQALAES